MRLLLNRAKNSRFFFHIYAATLLVAFHYFLVTYVNSTFLSHYFKPSTVGWLYAIGSVVNIIVFLNIAKILNRFGNRKSVIVFATLELCALLCLAFSHHVWLIVLAFIVHDIMFPTLIFHLDIFTESATKNEKTGSVRGTFLSLISVAALISPVIVGRLVDSGRFFEIYLISAAFIVAFITLVFFAFRSFEDKPYKVFKTSEVAREFFGNRDIRGAALSSFFLNFFYCWMIVYVPIYLYEHVGFSWTDIGLIISSSIIPFILFEFPLGELADKRRHEKNIIVAGFIIVIVTLLAFPLITGTSFFLWAAVLFIGRTGACAIEVSTESYFFRQINSANGELMSFWRMNIPVSYIAGTVVGSLSLLFVPYRFIFWVLAAVMMVGLLFVMRLRNNRSVVRPSILVNAGYGNLFDSQKIWASVGQIVRIPIDELTWNFNLPFWEKDGTDDWNLTPWQVINHADGSAEHFSRTMSVDTTYPINVVKNEHDQWIVIDGLHRLTKLFIEGKKNVEAKVIDQNNVSTLLR